MNISNQRKPWAAPSLQVIPTVNAQAKTAGASDGSSSRRQVS